MNTTIATVTFALVGSVAYADPMTCNLVAYKGTPGLSASVADNTLTVVWDGDRSQELRMRLGLVSGTPTLLELATRRRGAQWGTLASNASPDFRVVSGLRRMSNQQMVPLRGLGVELTPEIVDKYRFEPFWDAPLDLSAPSGRGGNPPPAGRVANQPGLPRNPEEIKRAAAAYRATSCEVKTDGARLEIAFPGVQLGVFAGTLQYSVLKGTNLIQQEILATTNEPWVAYKYDAGLKGLSIGTGSRVVWRDIASNWQDYRFGGVKNDNPVPLKTTGRVAIAERGPAGSIAVFPPPHNFFWAREIAINLGYNWYRKDSDSSFSFGVRQAEHEDESENQANFALYSARPGTTQRMTVFLYPSADTAQATYDQALAFTHGDHYKPLSGYQVMNHHYHMDLGQRLGAAGSLDADIPDLVAFKALGVTIVSQIDSVGGAENTPIGAVYPGARPVAGRGAGPGRAGAPAAGGGRGRGDELQIRHNSIEGARRHSDSNFLVMPDQEYYGSPLGGHTDLLFSRAVYWTAGRTPNQPLVDNDPKFGKFYRIGDANDLMEMARREDVLINMPHPRTKGSGSQRTIVADVEWTFPLDFVEVVSGDGIKPYRQIISTTDLPAMGSHRFEIPFNASGKKWVRFAAWDSAGNGAMVQPVKLTF